MCWLKLARFVQVHMSIRYVLASTCAIWGTAVAQWLRCCAKNRKVASSIPDGVIGIFH